MEPPDTDKPFICGTMLMAREHAAGKPYVKTVIELDGSKHVEVIHPPVRPIRVAGTRPRPLKRWVTFMAAVVRMLAPRGGR